MAGSNKGTHSYIIVVFREKSKLQQLHHEERKYLSGHSKWKVLPCVHLYSKPQSSEGLKVGFNDLLMKCNEGYIYSPRSPTP